MRRISWTALDDGVPQFTRSQPSHFKVLSLVRRCVLSALQSLPTVSSSNLLPGFPPVPVSSPLRSCNTVSTAANRSTMVDGSDVWNIISVVLALAPLVVTFVYRQLPSTKFRVLESTLQETESLLSSSLESGLIPDSHSALKFVRYAEQCVLLPVLLFVCLTAVRLQSLVVAQTAKSRRVYAPASVSRQDVLATAEGHRVGAYQEHLHALRRRPGSAC